MCRRDQKSRLKAQQEDRQVQGVSRSRSSGPEHHRRRLEVQGQDGQDARADDRDDGIRRGKQGDSVSRRGQDVRAVKHSTQHATSVTRSSELVAESCYHVKETGSRHQDDRVVCIIVSVAGTDIVYKVNFKNKKQKKTFDN